MNWQDVLFGAAVAFAVSPFVWRVAEGLWMHVHGMVRSTCPDCGKRHWAQPDPFDGPDEEYLCARCAYVWALQQRAVDGGTLTKERADRLLDFISDPKNIARAKCLLCDTELEVTDDGVQPCPNGPHEDEVNRTRTKMRMGRSAWLPPFVEPEHCDHDPSEPHCSRCCDCLECGQIRWADEKHEQARHRMKKQHAKIVELLGKNGSMTGLDLVRESGGELRRGTVYVHLHEMEENGVVASERNGDARQRRYRLADRSGG